MKLRLTAFLTLISIIALCSPSARANESSDPTHGTRVTVKTNQTGAGLVYVSTATTTKSGSSYTHKKPADPKDSDYKEEMTVEWDTPGGGTQCEVKWYYYAKPQPGYKFVRWEGAVSDNNPTGEHVQTHTTKLPNHNPYTMTAIFVEDNPVTTTMNVPFGKIILDPEVPVMNQPVVATVQVNPYRIDGQHTRPNMMGQFDHWELDDVNVSSDETFEFTPTKSVTLKAVFSEKGGMPEAGRYYRIRNPFNRVLSLEGAYSLSLSAQDLDKTLMRWAYPIGNDDNTFPPTTSYSNISDDYRPLTVESSPSTIFYISKGTKGTTTLSDVVLDAQGTKTSSFTSQSLCIEKMTDTFYGYYGLRSNAVNGVGFKLMMRDTTGDIVNLSSFSNADGWAGVAFQPLDMDHIEDYYFAANASEDMTFLDGYWQSMYTSFPYKCVRGVKAYYIRLEDAISNNDKNYVLLTEIEDGIVPANTGVLLCSETPGTADNRLLPLAPDDAEVAGKEPVTDNLLSGVCQLYTGKSGAGRTNFDDSAMRIFGRSNDGTLGFYKLAPGEDGKPVELDNNRAFLDLTKLPAVKRGLVFRLTDRSVSGIEEIPATDDPVRYEDSVIYDLGGRRILSPKPGNIYIIDGKKVLYR